jgi:hypothetical protein
MAAAAPISEAKLAANRANAQFSTGPKTEDGKKKVSQNRVTHGLTGNAVVLSSEDLDAFRALAIRVNLELAPATAVENALVDTIVNCQWRAHRIAEWEGQLITESLDLSAGPQKPSRLMRLFSKSGDPAEALAKLQKYENAVHRQWRAALRELRLSKESRNRTFTGQNLTALNDFLKTTAAARAFAEADGMPPKQVSNSNPPDAGHATQSGSSDPIPPALQTSESLVFSATSRTPAIL